MLRSESERAKPGAHAPDAPALLHHDEHPGDLLTPSYPGFLLLLLALLVADIVLTVWFTSLGLAELNPHIAPIAGSFAAQITYKAPFALLLVAGTATLATSCDLLLPGAGRWPWMAVIGIYTVPVAWNLIAIQQRVVSAGAAVVAVLLPVGLYAIITGREIR